MSGNSLAILNKLFAIMLLQALAGEAMKGFVQRLHLQPQTFDLRLKCFRVHVVARIPQGPHVGKTKIACALVAKLDKAGVVGADWL